MGKVRSVLITSMLAALVALPTAGGATHGSFEGDCKGVTPVGHTATCTYSWLMEEGGFVSNIESHGNLHHTLAKGTVLVEWIDAAGFRIYSSECTYLGVSFDISANEFSQEGVGPFDLNNALCKNTYHRDQFRGGEVSLRVTATPTECDGLAECRYHGHIEISPPNAPF